MNRLALLSVSDKRGIVDLARELLSHGFGLISTGGTLSELWRAGVEARPVSELTGFPEVFGGRVKTLHPAIHGGILFRRGHTEDARARAAHGIEPIDLVVVNLYPFRETIAKPDISLEEAIEQIDVGGPALIRAAAKNFDHVAVVVDPDDYGDLVLELGSARGEVSLETREHLARKAFAHTASYDLAISKYLDQRAGVDKLPDRLVLDLERAQPLRYGENPHQRAALYHPTGGRPLNGAQCLQGKSLSYNNILDLSAALEAVAEFEAPAAVIVKHTNPCGVGRDDADLTEAYRRALASDPVSAFGGIVALNRALEEPLAELLAEQFYEVVSAPDASDAALARLAAKKNLRVVLAEPRRMPYAVAWRATPLGFLAQEPDPVVGAPEEADWKVVTQREPTAEELDALRFLWRVCKHVKSNAIVVGTAQQTLGIGAGQTSRVDSVRIALARAADKPQPATCLASDAFFPFRDGIDAAAAAGIRAIVQTGGSVRDAEVIAAADEHGLAMVTTGKRHFRH